MIYKLTMEDLLDESGADELNEITQRDVALSTISCAWDDALGEGVSQEMLASTAIFTAFSRMVETYGEDVVAEIATGLVERVRQGDFTPRGALN